VTEGLVLLAAWLEFGLLLGVLAFVVLTGGDRR
jgi:Flp pilus assembly pilin Flp